MKRVALLVGVENYHDPLIAPLSYAGADVAALEERLTGRCGFDEVTVLAEHGGHAAPDLHQVLRALDNAVAELEEDDLFLFYFSGHGIERDGRAYLLTRDSTHARPQLGSLSRDVLQDALRNARARRRILLFDACRNAPEQGRGAVDNLMPGAVSRDMIAAAQTAPGSGATTALLSACKEGTRAFEWANWGHGVFTHFLLEGLDGAAWDGDRLDFKDLASHTIRQVREFTVRAPGIQRAQEPWYQEFGNADRILLGGGAAHQRVTPSAPPPASSPPPIAPVVRREWYYCAAEGQRGPCTLELLMELAASGGIAGDTLVWRAGMSAWATAGEVRELAGHVRNTPQQFIVPPTPVQPPRQESGLVAGTVRTFAGIEMVWCPPGEFLMGSPDNDDDAYDHEKPQHRVRITEGFWLGKYPVTQAQWEGIMGENPSCFKVSDRPVESVSWDDCQSFCRMLTQAGGGIFRLPTEGEWEYACRAGTTARYFLGRDDSHLQEYAWYSENSEGESNSVGRLKPNPWGIYDILGNVCEYCQDWYGDYPEGSVTNQTGTPSGQYRVLRGGSWKHNSRNCRSASRGYNNPNVRSSFVGFRVVRTP